MAEVTLKPIQSDTLWQRFRDALPPYTVLALTAIIGLLIPALLLEFPMGYAIGGVVGLLAIAAIVACPYVGLLVFLALLYLRPEEMFPQLAGARFTLTVSVLVLFAWAINAFLCRERFNLHLPAVQCFLGFLVVGVGSTALSGSQAFPDEVIELLKLLILFVLIVHLVNSEARLALVAGALVLFTTILGARTIWDYQHGQALVQSDGAVRALATGIFGDPNDLALAMAMALPLAMGAVFGKRSWWARLWNLASVPVLLWTIYVTDSRGGMLALGAAVFAFFSRRLGRFGIILGAVAVLGLFAFGPSRMSQMSSDDESAQGRVQAWQAGFDMLQSSPIWGVGKGQFTEHHFRTAHNSVVLCFAELGIAGLALWIGLFYFAFRGGRRAPADAAMPDPAGPEIPTSKPRRGQPYSTLIQVSLVAFLVVGFFLSRTYTPPLYVYLGLGIAARLVEADQAGEAPALATGLDWRNIAALTVGAIILVAVLIRLWS